MHYRFVRALLLLLTVLLFFRDVRAQSTDQNYPVTAQAFIVAQPNQRLSSYFSSSTALSVNLLLKDLTKNSIQVYLRWSMEGPGVRVSSMDGYIPANLITLDRGMIRRFSGLDLQHDYFRQDLIEEQGLGNSPLRTNLPEGFYTFRVQALEAGTGREVSNIGETYFSITTPLPPIINIPFNGAELTMTEPQRVNIQWMPRHYRMPGNITTYDLKVCKVPDGYEPTEALDACVNPVIDDKGNPGTFYPGNTGIGNSLIGALERGARYAARVTVHEFDTDGNEVVFVNEGRSEVNWFRYGKECVSPESFVITETGPGRLQLKWEAATDVDSYKVLYRKTGDTKWTAQIVSATTASITDLALGSYEFAIQSGCTDIVPDHVQTFEVTDESDDLEDLPIVLADPMQISVQVSGCTAVTPGELANYYVNFPGTDGTVPSDTTGKLKLPGCALQSSAFSVCSPEHPMVPLLTGGTELANLKTGDVLGIYDFAVFVTEVSGSGTSVRGSFSGKGLVRLPFLEGTLALAEFSGVKAIRSDDGNGGCVYEATNFRLLNVPQSEVAAAKSKLLSTLAQQTDPAAYAGTLAGALAGYEALADSGVPPTTSDSLLCPYTTAILQASEEIRKALADAGGDNRDPRITDILNDLKTITDQLTAGSPKVDSITQKYEDLISKLDAFKKDSQTDGTDRPEYVIRNVVVSAIDNVSARINWEMSGTVTKYVIEYQDKDGGVLQETVTDPQISLLRLREGMDYRYKISAYNGDQVVASSEGSFTTIKETVPAPVNLAYTRLNDNSVKITWDKNAVHDSYKLVYTDEKGILRTVYPTTNETTLIDLDPLQFYNYEIVAYNKRELASDPALSDIKLIDCSVSIKASATIISENETIKLSASGCVDGLLKWSNGEQGAQQITISPLKSDTYFVVCERTAGSLVKVCADYSEITVQPATCSGFIITASKSSIEKGDPVTLTATGCDGQLTWDMDLGSTGVITVYPQVTSVFKANCVKKDGSFCTTSGKVKVSCNINLSVATYTEWRWLRESTKIITVTASCNYDNLVLNGLKLPKGYYNNDYSIAVDGGSDHTFTASCGNGEDICTEVLKVESLKKKCRDFKINHRIEAGNLVLETSGCGEGNTVVWDNSVGNKQLIVPLPLKTTTFKARCTKSDCETYYNYYVKNDNVLKVQMVSNSPQTLEAGKCDGQIYWSSEPLSNFTASGNTLKIQTEPEKTTVYTASCKTVDNQVSQASYTLAVPAKCSYILSPESITLGNVVKLEVIGCTGTASWKAGLTDIGTGQIIYHTPLSSTTYSMSCDQPVCDVSRTVSVESSDFTVTAAKTFAKIAEPVLLNSSGCSGGTIQWSTGETGEVITVRPLSETTYIASCILNGISVSDKNVAIKVDNAPPEDITCPDFQLQVPEGNFPKDAMVTIQPVNCPAGSKIIWSDGTVAGNTELYIVKLSEGQKVSATCVTPYQMKVKAEVSLAISDGVISVSPTSVTNNVPTVLTASGCFYNETYQWKNGSTIQSSVQSITVQLTKATTYTVSCLDNTGTIRKSRDFPITVTGSGLNCDNLGITEFNGKSARDINSAYYLVAPAEAIKMKFTCDGCSGSLVWSVNGERIENGENGTIDNQTLTYETIAPSSPGELTYRVNVNGCEKTFKVAVFSCETYKANIAWDGSAAYATISASYCPAYASVFDNAGSTPVTTLTSPSGQPNEYQSTVGQGTYKVICNVRGVDNQDRAYTISKLSFTAADFTSRQKFNRASYCDDVSGPANESCLLDINQVNKNNGLIELRVTNAASCTTGIIWTSDGGASGSGETLTVKQPENDQTEYYTASCNSEKCKGGTWVNGPYTPSADNPCKGLDKDFSRTYTKDEPVILQMSNCPGTVTWFKDPNRQDLICTLPTAAGKTTFTVGKLNATTLYYYNCQLKDGTICQSVGAAKIKGSSNGRVAADNVSKTTTTGQIANTPLSTSGSNMRVASTVIEEVCSNSVSLTSVMKEFYSKMLCQDVNIYTGDRIVAEKYLDQLLSRIPNNVSGTVIKSPSDKSGVIEKMYEGKCEDAVDLLVAPNNGVMVPVADANDNVVSRYGQIHDASIEEVVIIPKIISQLAEEAQIADALVNCEGSRRLGNIKFQGTLEHWLIQYDYIYSQNLNAFMEFKIPKSSPSGNLGYADLAVPITGEIFEIKPDNDQGIRAGRNEVENYISKANLECPNPLQWKKGLNYKPRILPYPKQPLKQLVTRLEEGGVIVYNVQDKSGKPQPVLVPQNILDKIKKWVDRIGQNPQNLEREIVVFLRENPEVATYLKGVAVGAAAGIVVATIVEDVITAGVGIADDWASFALAYKLVRVAQIL